MYPVVAVRPSRATVGWEGHWEDAIPPVALERILSAVDEEGFTAAGAAMLESQCLREPSKRVERTAEEVRRVAGERNRKRWNPRYRRK